MDIPEGQNKVEATLATLAEFLRGQTVPLSTREASSEAIANYDPATARLLSMLGFVHFEDIFINLFDRDQTCDLTIGAPPTIKDSGVQTSTHQIWRSFLRNGRNR